MNILPKKNWHVRKKENIARVRKDEAEAAEKEGEIERRAKVAEQEARLAFLRNRGGHATESRNLNSDTTQEEFKEHADIFTSSGNINFFKEHEKNGEISAGTNKEYEQEKKDEKEDFEKKIGLLTYLGQSTLESNKLAWFNEGQHIISKRNRSNKDDEIGLKNKLKLDPLSEMKKHTTVSFNPKPVETQLFDPLPCPKTLKSKKSSKRKKNKKHKLKKRKRKNSVSSGSERESKKKKKYTKKKVNENLPDDGEKLKLTKMREERLKREALERKREERLRAGKNPDMDEKSDSKLAPFKQKYNSQFNPHLAKQNKDIQNTQSTSLQTGVKYWLC